MLLKFSKGNAKLAKNVYTFSLLAGHSCPFARDCLAKAIEQSGKRVLRDGAQAEFRCFSASAEVQYDNTYKARKHNFDLVRQAKTKAKIRDLILSSLPKRARIIRIHVSGDFYSQAYFDAWIEVAKTRSDVHFYAYTKSLPYVVKRLGSLPSNLVITASRGGRRDDLIELHDIREARVVYSETEAQDLGLDIDHDDSHAMRQGPSFALLLHGVQPKGTKAGEAMRVLRAKGKTGYNRKARKALALVA